MRQSVLVDDSSTYVFISAVLGMEADLNGWYDQCKCVGAVPNLLTSTRNNILFKFNCVLDVGKCWWVCWNGWKYNTSIAGLLGNLQGHWRGEQ